VLQLRVFRAEVLILVQQIVDFELQLGNMYFLPAELILDFDQSVFKLNPHLSLRIEVVLVFLLGLLEFLPLIFEHKLELSHIVVFIGQVV
jgi:hypothetical protein